MHCWGDNNVDWSGISDCAIYIQDYLHKWGRMWVYAKEKYGRVDVSLQTGWHQLHNITHPGYVYSRYPKWLWNLDCKYISHVIALIPGVHMYHMWLVRRVYRNALKKWPHLREEILAGAPHELGSEFGIHYVRTGEHSFEIHRDWHPDNFSVRHPPVLEEETQLGKWDGPFRRLK